jgi:hypothetical protein
LTAAAASTLLLLGVATTSQAATTITVKNPGGLTAVGPVNNEYGFPAYYEDKTGTRLEPCLDLLNPYCGLLPGDVPDPDAPVSFPDNFPGEFFYQLIGSDLALPGGGEATLTLGVEGAWAAEEVVPGDQVTFARTRVVVKGGPRNTTVTFKHPFGELTIDTDGTGSGRLVQDVSPAAGNFTTALKGNFGPFLKWDPAVAPAAPDGYVGDPGVEHKVVGGRDGYNAFSMTSGGVTTSTDQFTIQGKLATNTGVTGDRAVVNDGFIDVFATSKGEQLQVDGVDGQYVTTPMTHDAGSDRHYARLALAAGAKPSEVTVRNLGDKPVSFTTIKLADVTVTQADYDGTNLTVAADSDNYPLTVAGFDAPLTSAEPVTFETKSPPSTVSVKSAKGAAVTYPITVTGGSASRPALPPAEPEPDPGPVNDNTDNNPAPTGVPVVNVATVADTLPGAAVTLDASTSTDATSYAWTQVSAPAGTSIVNATSAKPTVTLPAFITNAATAPVTDWEPVVFKVTATNVNGTTEKEVIIPVKKDTVTINTGSRHRVGTELRINGTSLVDGAAGTRTPATVVTVWNTTVADSPVKLGTATVDALGAWELRQKPGPSARVTSVLVQSTRGGTSISAVGN